MTKDRRVGSVAGELRAHRPNEPPRRWQAHALSKEDLPRLGAKSLGSMFVGHKYGGSSSQHIEQLGAGATRGPGRRPTTGRERIQADETFEA
jgi:hypothetical protein